MPEAKGQRAGLDALRSGEEPLTYQPQPPQAQISMQADSPVPLNRVVHGPHRNTDLPGNIATVDGMPDIAGQQRLDIPENPELPVGIRVQGPFRRHPA